MNSKEQNSRALDPRRHMIAQKNALMPGGPQNNNPDPVIQSSGTPIIGRSIYNDFTQNYPQMGSAVLNPEQIARSNVSPLGQAPQPPDADGMESGRLVAEVNKQGVPAGAMGYQGLPAIPGGIAPTMPGTSGPSLMQPMNSMNAMTPGATKITKNKRA